MFILTQYRTEIVDISKCFGICIVEDSAVIRAYCNDTNNWIRLGIYKQENEQKK